MSVHAAAADRPGGRAALEAFARPLADGAFGRPGDPDDDAPDDAGFGAVRPVPLLRLEQGRHAQRARGSERQRRAAQRDLHERSS